MATPCFSLRSPGAICKCPLSFALPSFLLFIHFFRGHFYPFCISSLSPSVLFHGQWCSCSSGATHTAIRWLILKKKLIAGIKLLFTLKKNVHIRYIPACSFSCTTGSFVHLLCLFFPLLCALFAPFLLALSLLLRSFYLDVFLCINPTLLLPQTFFTILSYLFPSPLPMCSIIPIHTEVSFSVVFFVCALLFSVHPLCRRRRLFFSWSPYQAWLTFQLFLQWSSSSRV